MRRKHIVFVVIGNSTVGLGHVYNTLLLANDILNHQVTFLADSNSQIAYEKIASKNYPVLIQQSENIVDEIQALSPDLVINDRLDTTLEYMEALKKLSIKIVNFKI